MKARKSIRPLLMAAALLSVGMLGAAPQAPAIRAGSASISTGSSTVINQSTSSLAIDWQSFDLAAGESVRFNQPSPGSVALNRVISGSPTSIFGRIDANGRVILVNSAGILFGAGSQVNTGAFVASSLELDESTLGSDRLRFFGAGASVENAGSLNGQEFVAVVAPTIVNSGSVRGASVALAAGSEVIISTAGGLFDVQVPAAAVKAAIENKGGVIATQGNAYLTARGVSAAASSLSNPGKVEATGMVERDGRIYLESDGALTSVGEVKATRVSDGGDIEIKGGFVALGGTVSADGVKGGSIKVESAGMLSLAENVTAKGLVTTGGSITYRSAGQTIENSTGFSDVSGRTDGGRVSLDAEQGVMSSGRYLAVGGSGKGGMIDLTGYGVRLLSATLDASGKTQGGLIRVGGAFQGGKNLGIRGDNGDLLQAYVGRWSEVADISNAQRTLVNDSSILKVSATSGEGGTAVVWSDLQTTIAGKVFAGGIRGGVAEISSAGELRKAAIDQITGARHILLDPKNIVVGTNADLGAWTYSAIIGNDYAGGGRLNLSTLPGLSVNLDNEDSFGTSVALNADASLFVVGAPADSGASNSLPDSGCVRLFIMGSGNYSGATLKGVVGAGYVGGGNLDIQLESGDYFGSSVALSGDGRTMAVGAAFDDGYGNLLPGSGCVRIIRFGDNRFNGGSVLYTIGHGYPGSVNNNWSYPLQADGLFGWSVALNANAALMAVGSPGEDDTNPLNYKADRGNVRLFSLGDGSSSNGAYAASVVHDLFNGYSNNPGAINHMDCFGWSVALNGAGDRMAIGAPGDDGGYDSHSDSGVVRLYTFADASFTNGQVVAFIGVSQFSWYDSWKVLNVTSIDSGEYFGRSVALSGDARTLAVGSPMDGYSGYGSPAGSVRLFRFTDSAFNGGSLVSTLGVGYAGTNDINLTKTLIGSTNFGASLALSADSSLLAVGSTWENNSTGRVRLFSFQNDSLSGGSEVFTIGLGLKASYSAPDASDYFGGSLSLNATGDRLVVGAPRDDSANFTGDDVYNYGSVRLFTFSDDSFSGGALVGVIGKGYTGGRNIDVASLDAGDGFGSSVSLNAVGDRLAVGAPGDDGATYVGSTNYDYGSVRLFTFSDNSFSGGALAGVIGGGYAGGRNVDIAGYGGAIDLDVLDLFGTAVSLNATGDRLAVGAPGDDGSSLAGDNGSGFGNVRLFTFSDTSFNGGILDGVIGKGFREGVNTNQLTVNGLDSNDKFGSAVSLNAVGNRIVVGAPGDDGATYSGDGGYEYGSVRLFALIDGYHSVGSLAGVIGKGYVGARSADIANLDAGDRFGSAVSLNAAGDRLAVGSPGDDGALYAGSGSYEYGNVRLFTFQDASFNGVVLSGVLGKGYAGGQNIDIPSLDAVDRFGSAVSFNAIGDQLAVGIPGDDGATYVGSGSYEYGSVMLFRLGASTLTNNSFGSLPGADSLISSTQVSAALASGTAITLQANNDITIASSIDAGVGSAGELLLYAGRNVRFDADVRIGSRDLGVIANASAADGVIGAHRDAGQGGFTMAPGVSVVAGDFALLVRGVDTSSSNPNSSPGSVTLGNVTASSLTVGILGSGLNGRTITQNVGSSISVSGDVVLGNQAGDISLAEIGNGSWSGTTSLSASGSLAVRSASGLTIDTLSAASFDVRSSGVVNVTGPVSLGASGYGFISSTSAAFSDDINLAASADMRVNASGSITLAGITPSLATGSKLRFYGCDDVIVSAAVSATAGSTGELLLTAGRDVKLNASLDLGSADLLARANARVADGIFGAYRPVGQGDFTMASGTLLEADSVTVIVRGVDTDVTNVNSSPGGIVLADVAAGSLTLAIEGSGFTDRAINQYVGSGISVAGNASVTNSLGNVVLSSALNGAWRGTTTLSSAGAASLKVSSTLNLGGLSASGFSVISSGPMRVAGATSLGSFGSGLLQAPGIDIAGSVSVGMFSTLNAASGREMRLTGALASMATGASLRLWSTNLAIDPTNRMGYNYRSYGATYGITNVTSQGIGWLYSLSSPYALTPPSAMSGSGGMSLQSANYYSPADVFFRGPSPLPSPLAPRPFESLLRSGELILPSPAALYEWEIIERSETNRKRELFRDYSFIN